MRWAAVLLLCVSSWARGEEGFWVPLPGSPETAPFLRSNPGAADLWEPPGAGLMSAVCRVGGGSGAFVSRDGLILTNHHVVYPALQLLSTPSKDYLSDGFTAAGRGAELRAPGVEVLEVAEICDVTDRVLAGLDLSSAGPRLLDLADKRCGEIARGREKKGRVECRVRFVPATARFLLHAYRRIRDVRLVWAPPGHVASFGGESDNWRWPRTCGDVALLRAYVSPDGDGADCDTRNVPFRPRSPFGVSRQGVREGDLVWAAGFPGWSHRHGSALELTGVEIPSLECRSGLLKTLLGIRESAAEGNPSLRLAMSEKIKSLSNVLQHDRMALDAVARPGFLGLRRAEEGRADELTAGLDGTKCVTSARREAERMTRRRAGRVRRDFLLNAVFQYCDLASWAATITRWSAERGKPDAFRDPDYRSGRERYWRDRLREGQKGFDPASDQGALAAVLDQMDSLPAGQRVRALDDVLRDVRATERHTAIRGFVRRLYSGTLLQDPGMRLRMFRMRNEDVRRLRDPFMDFMYKLADDVRDMKKKRREEDSALFLWSLRRASVAEQAGCLPRYPDADGTLRLSYGRTRPVFRPGGATAGWMTTLGQFLSRRTGTPPFRLEDETARDWEGAAPPWETPVAFASDLDVAPGSSGSPVLDARGGLVGVVFDSDASACAPEWEYSAEATRAIAVDARFLLFLLGRDPAAAAVLREMAPPR